MTEKIAKILRPQILYRLDFETKIKQKRTGVDALKPNLKLMIKLHEKSFSFYNSMLPCSKMTMRYNYYVGGPRSNADTYSPM